MIKYVLSFLMWLILVYIFSSIAICDIDDFGSLEFMWVLYFTKYIFIPKKHDRNGRLIREVEIDEIRLIGISSKYKFVV